MWRSGDRRLAIAAFFVPLTRFLMFIFFIVAWPVAKGIDYFLGEDRMQLFRRSELKKLLELHTDEVGSRETRMLHGVLDKALDARITSTRGAAWKDTMEVTIQTPQQTYQVDLPHDGTS